jgi:hypothetical protein
MITPTLTFFTPSGQLGLVAGPTHTLASTLERKPLSHHELDPYSPTPPLATSSGMASPIGATQVPETGNPHAHWQGNGRSSPRPTILSATMVNERRSNERSSIKLKISSGGAKIVNAVVVDPAGRPLYTVSSDESCTELLSQSDNTKVATIDWDRSSPRMVFRGKKIKCKDWLPRAGPDTEYVLLFLPHALSPL